MNKHVNTPADHFAVVLETYPELAFKVKTFTPGPDVDPFAEFKLCHAVFNEYQRAAEYAAYKHWRFCIPKY